MTQIGAGSNEAALAQVDAAAYASDQQARYGLASKLLDWLNVTKQMALSERLTMAGLESSEQIAQIQANSAASSNALAAQTAYQQSQAALQAQLAAIRAAQSNSSNQMWSNIFGTGLQTFAPILSDWLGNNSGGGGWYGTPGFNPGMSFGSGGGGWSFGGGW